MKCCQRRQGRCNHRIRNNGYSHIGGFTGAVEHALIGMPVKFGYVAVEDEYGEVGPQDYLRIRYDLTDDHIVKLIKGM